MPARPGEHGRVLVTDLDNFVMPFVRYDTGDIAVQGSPCSCGRGFPTIERIEGRSAEQILTPGGRFISAAILGIMDVSSVWRTLHEIPNLETGRVNLGLTTGRKIQEITLDDWGR